MADIPIAAMKAVAERLDGLGLDYAFLGGSVVGLLLDHPELSPVRATDDVEKVRLFIGQGLLMTLQALVLVTGTVIILLATNFQLTLVVLPTLQWVLSTVVFITGVVTVISIIPSFIAARLKPVSAMQHAG